MQLTQPLQAGASRPLSEVFASVEERVVESKVRARRRWVIRTGLLLLSTSAILCGFLAWQRDSTHIALSLQAINQPVAALQAKIDQLGQLPAVVPEFDGSAIESYAGSADRFFAVNSTRPVIVAFSSIVPVTLGQDGRCVIIYDHGKVYSDWMRQGRFAAAMQAQLEAMNAFEQQRHNRPPALP